MKPDDAEVEISLAEVVEGRLLTSVCQSFSELHGIGITVLDQDGTVLVQVLPDAAPCPRFFDAVGPSPKVHHFNKNSISCHIPPDGRPKRFGCDCGASGLAVPLLHHGKPLGRLAVGPFNSAETPLDLDNWRLPEECGSQKGGPDEGLPVVSSERVAAITRATADVLTSLVEVGYGRHLTARIHMAALQDAYSELSDKNRRLADSVEKLKDLDRMKSAFMATVSHELRTPLTSIIGYSEMLMEGIAGDMAGRQREFIRVIRGKGHQLMQVISDVLDISRIERRMVCARPVKVDVARELAAALDSARPQAGLKGLTLVWDVPPDLPEAWLDPTKFRQTMVNLVNNAIKFSPQDGTVRLTAEVHHDGSSDPVDHRLEVHVSDQGTGVPAPDRERIFEPFFQADNSTTREFGGAGLGLSIVKSFVEAHGGRVWVSSANPSGSVFSVSLPLDARGRCTGPRAASGRIDGG